MGLDVYLARGESAKQVTYGDGADAETYTEYEDREYYLRSSYNESGYNTVTENVLGQYGYYWTFEPWIKDAQDYEYPCTDPAVLADCLARAVHQEAAWKATAQEGIHSCFTVSSYSGSDELLPTTAGQVMTLFRTEQTRWADLEKKVPSFDAYSNQDGYYSRSGITVSAIVPGKEYGKPCAYVVYKMGDEGVAYYLEAAKKAVELVTAAITMLEAGSTPVINWSA